MQFFTDFCEKNLSFGKETVRKTMLGSGLVWALWGQIENLFGHS
jgi:hypothetical protein